MLKHAFKEWAVICKALAEGYQMLILRKGGILEIGSGFEVEHESFWLFPTYTHQQETGIVTAALPMLEQVQARRPPEGMTRLSHFANVLDVIHVTNLERLLALGGMHFWSEETVRQRFHYRRPGLFVLTLRVFQASHPFELPNTPHYDGCKTWVELQSPLPTDEACPVLSEAALQEQRATIKALLASGGLNARRHQAGGSQH